MHKLLAHVLDAIKLHGAIKNGKTGSNEKLHGDEKRRYCMNSKDGDHFRAQLLRVGQRLFEIKARQAREDAEFDEWFDGGGNDVNTLATSVFNSSVGPTGGGVASLRTATITPHGLANGLASALLARHSKFLSPRPPCAQPTPEHFPPDTHVASAETPSCTCAPPHSTAVPLV